MRDMLEKIKGIVIDSVRHTDKHNVVVLYTESRGRMAFLVPAVNTRSGRMRATALSLMACVETEVNFKEGKELYHIRQVSPLRLWHDIYFDPVKSALLFFLAEFCNRLLRQSPPDKILWEYIVNELDRLDRMPTSRVANFHIHFLTGMMQFIGIAPSPRRYEEGLLFDMLAGEMTDPKLGSFSRRHSYLTAQESRFVPKLLRMTGYNFWKFRFTSEQRMHVLNRILEYYSLHLPMGAPLKSLDILREIFA